MSVVLGCCEGRSKQQVYIGVDSTCAQPAIFCIEHSPHRNQEGLMHQMMPLSQFRRTINEKKFIMADRVGSLIEDYCHFMDSLIEQLNQLKLNKSVQLNMLWLRELSTNEEEYEALRRLYRNDYSGLSCRDVHELYFKVVGKHGLEAQTIEDIPCYADIAKTMKALTQSAKGQLLITQKVAELQGVVQKGELLRRALPDRKVLREHTKEILLEAHSSELFDIRYNRAVLKKGGRNYESLFSKYPLLPHTNYHLLIKSKYSNVLVGICGGETRKQSIEDKDLHYHAQSLTYNCSNGCVYRDGMFESGSATLTKGVKELELLLRITDEEMLLLIGKHVVCRVTRIKQDKIYLHALLRTQKDSIQIDRDKVASQEQPESAQAPLSVMNDSMKADFSVNLGLEPSEVSKNVKDNRSVRFHLDLPQGQVVNQKTKNSHIIDKPTKISIFPPSGSLSPPVFTPTLKASPVDQDEIRGEESVVLEREAVAARTSDFPAVKIDFLNMLSPISGSLEGVETNRHKAGDAANESILSNPQNGNKDSIYLGKTQMMKTNKADNSNINIVMEKSMWSQDIRQSKDKDIIESQCSPDLEKILPYQTQFGAGSSLIPPLKRTQFDSPSLRESEDLKGTLRGPTMIKKRSSDFESPRDIRRTQNNDEWL